MLSDEKLSSIYRKAQTNGMKYEEAIQAGLRAVAEAAIADLKVNALFESVTDYPSGAVRASQYVAVKRTERADDGSLTVVIDYWPTRKTTVKPAMPLSTRELPNLPPLESERAWDNGPYRYTESQMLAYGQAAIATFIVKNWVST